MVKRNGAAAHFARSRKEQENETRTQKPRRFEEVAGKLHQCYGTVKKQKYVAALWAQ